MARPIDPMRPRIRFVLVSTRFMLMGTPYMHAGIRVVHVPIRSMGSRIRQIDRRIGCRRMRRKRGAITRPSCMAERA
jgi:hypothetical protein